MYCRLSFSNSYFIEASDNDAGYYGDVTYSLIGNGADM